MLAFTANILHMMSRVAVVRWWQLGARTSAESSYLEFLQQFGLLMQC